MVEISVKFTVIGKQPLVMSEVKSATGDWATAIVPVRKQVSVVKQMPEIILYLMKFMWR